MLPTQNLNRLRNRSVPPSGPAGSASCSRPVSPADRWRRLPSSEGRGSGSALAPAPAWRHSSAWNSEMTTRGSTDCRECSRTSSTAVGGWMKTPRRPNQRTWIHLHPPEDETAAPCLHVYMFTGSRPALCLVQPLRHHHNKPDQKRPSCSSQRLDPQISDQSGPALQ